MFPFQRRTRNKVGYIQWPARNKREDFLLLPEGSCVSACPDGFYGDEDTNDCEECHPDCATCGGPEESDCVSCREGDVLENGECVSEHEACPAKTFRSGEASAGALRLIQPSALYETGIWEPSPGQGRDGGG